MGSSTDQSHCLRGQALAYTGALFLVGGLSGLLLGLAVSSGRPQFAHTILMVPLTLGLAVPLLYMLHSMSRTPLRFASHRHRTHYRIAAWTAIITTGLVLVGWGYFSGANSRDGWKPGVEEILTPLSLEAASSYDQGLTVKIFSPDPSEGLFIASYPGLSLDDVSTLVQTSSASAEWEAVCKRRKTTEKSLRVCYLTDGSTVGRALIERESSSSVKLTLRFVASESQLFEEWKLNISPG